MKSRSAWIALTVIMAVATVGTPLFAAGQGESPAATADDGPLELEWMSGLYESVPDMDNTWWVEFQKETNTKLDIQWVPSGDYASKFDLVMASGDLPEIIVGLDQSSPTLITAIKRGAFWNLSPLLGDFSDYPNLRDNMTPGAWNYVKVDGKIWGIPRNRPQIDLQFKIRQDWLDQLSIPMPTTFEEWRVALRQIVNADIDGNGKKDTFGLVGNDYLLNDSHGVLMAGFGALDDQFDSDGGMIHAYLKDNYAHMIEWLRAVYADGSLAREFSVMKRQAAEELFTSGRAASYTRNIWRDYFYQEKIRATQPNAVVATMPPLQSPYGTAAWLAKGVYGAHYISSKVPEEKVVRILDYFDRTTNEEYLNLTYFGIEGIHHNVVDGVRVMTDQGKSEVGTSVMQPATLMRNTWAKVVYPGAPKEYNDAKLAQVAELAEIGQINPFEVLVSDTWTTIWPRYDSEFKSMGVKAIVGQISMDEYRAYLRKLREMPEFKKAFQEFAGNYKDKFGQ